MTIKFFNKLHQSARDDRCGICPIINVYAEPYRCQESDDWFHYISPVILYCYNRTYLTIGRGVNTFHFPDKVETNFWVFYPDDKTLKKYYKKLKAHNFDSRF